MKRKNNKDYKNYIPLLVSIFVLVIVFIIIFTFVLGKTDDSYRDSKLDDMEYILEGNTYYKNMTNNTLDEFYTSVKNNQNNSFLEYKFEIDSNSFYETKLDYNNGITSSYMYSYELYTNTIFITYELSTLNSNVIISGKYNEYDNSIKCNIEGTNNYSSSLTLDEYCNTLANNINDFIIERDKFINDSRFVSILNNDHSEVVIGEE